MSHTHYGTPNQKFRSIREVAELFGVSTKTVRRWIDSDDLAAHRLGRQWRISRDGLETFLAHHLSDGRYVL